MVLNCSTGSRTFLPIYRYRYMHMYNHVDCASLDCFGDQAPLLCFGTQAHPASQCVGILGRLGSSLE